jgi:O-antigen ligase
LHTHGFFSLSKLMGFFYLCVMVPLIINFRTPDDFKPFLKPIWVFLALLTIVSLFNVKTDHYNFIDFTIFQNIILFWILINHENQDNLILEKAMIGFALGSILLALLFHFNIGISTDDSGRTSIFGDNANNVGMRMSISLIIIPLILIQNRLGLGKRRYLLILGVPFVLRLMIATGSRVAFISFFLSFISFIILFKTKKIWGKLISSLICILILIYIWQVLLKSDEIIQRLLMTIQEGDLSERDIVWRKLLPLWTNHPIFGVGKTGYAFYNLMSFGRVLTSPHNVILEVLILTGITGLIIYLIFLYRIMQTSYKIFRDNNLLLPLLLLIPILGLLLSAQLLEVKIGWVIFAYIAGSSILVFEKEQKYL